jgi:hypothetical protein
MMTRVRGRDGDGDLSRSTNAAGMFLSACLVAFCLSILLVAGVSAGRLASRLDARLAGEITIVVWGQGLESADAAAARTSELIARQAGVRTASVPEPDEIDATIGELAAGRSPRNDGPRLVSVNGTPGAMPSTSKLRSLLDANRIVAVIDDRRGKAGPLESRAIAAGALGGLLALILCGGFFAISSISGGRAVVTAAPRFDLMTRLGADPSFIGALVGRRLGVVAFTGGVFGTLGADVLLLAATSAPELWRRLGAIAVIEPRLSDSVWTMACPLLVAAIGASAGGFSAARQMARRERRI